MIAIPCRDLHCEVIDKLMGSEVGKIAGFPYQIAHARDGDRVIVETDSLPPDVDARLREVIVLGEGQPISLSPRSTLRAKLQAGTATQAEMSEALAMLL